MDFTNKILRIMDERGITAYQICKNLHISNTTFSSWKKGTKPSIDKAIEILRYLQLSADEIFELTNNSEVLTESEKLLLNAYRQANPGIQETIRKLLHVPELETKSSTCSAGKEAI